MYRYTMTNDTVTVIVKGEPITVAKGAPNYVALRAALLNENWAEVPKHLTVVAAVETWAAQASTPAAPAPSRVVTITAPAEPAKAAPTPVAPVAPPASAPVPEGTVKVIGDSVTYNGEPLPRELNDRILKAVSKGEDANGLINFWKRLKRNPNTRSVEQLWRFLGHCGLPVQPDGTFLAYKGVRRDFRDAHSGKFDNSPGKIVKMDRSKISTDPAQTCHTGLHVGALAYANSFSQTCLVVRVDPEHVCCVPNDHSAQKMRVCEYAVMGLYGAQLPDTAFDAKAESAVVVEEAAPIVETEDKDEAPKVEEQQIPVTGTPWDDFNPMGAEELAKQSLDDLRKYARYNCLISGASKIPGGKDALIAKIVEARTRGTLPEPEPVVEVEEVLTHPEAVTEVEETRPLAPDQEAAVKVPLTGTNWDHLNGMNSLTLMEQSLDDLRKYATYNCLIVGASKIPGGKLNLVARICQVRGDGA